jgi:hypothetical protein
MTYLATELRRISAFVGAMFRERKLESVETMLALQEVVFGLWLLAPWSSFGSIAGVYDSLAMMPEGVWGSVFALQGAIHLRAIDRRDLCWRRRFTSGLVLLWAMMLMGFLSTAPASTATPMYFLPVMGGLWCYHAHTLIAGDRRRVPRD